MTFSQRYYKISKLCLRASLQTGNIGIIVLLMVIKILTKFYLLVSLRACVIHYVIHYNRFSMYILMKRDMGMYVKSVVEELHS